MKTTRKQKALPTPPRDYELPCHRFLGRFTKLFMGLFLQTLSKSNQNGADYAIIFMLFLPTDILCQAGFISAHWIHNAIKSLMAFLHQPFSNHLYHLQVLRKLTNKEEAS